MHSHISFEPCFRTSKCFRYLQVSREHARKSGKSFTQHIPLAVSFSENYDLTLFSNWPDLILSGAVKARARQMIIVTKTNGSARDSPCIFSVSNVHEPHIEGGRGVDLPRESRGNELRVTRARRDTLLSLSLSSFFFFSCGVYITCTAPKQNSLLSYHQSTTRLLTITRDTSITEINTCALCYD